MGLWKEMREKGEMGKRGEGRGVQERRGEKGRGNESEGENGDERG